MNRIPFEEFFHRELRSQYQRGSGILREFFNHPRKIHIIHDHAYRVTKVILLNFFAPGVTVEAAPGKLPFAYRIEEEDEPRGPGSHPQARLGQRINVPLDSRELHQAVDLIAERPLRSLVGAVMCKHRENVEIPSIYRNSLARHLQNEG